MATVKVSLKADAGIFKGLSQQNMQFHQCVAELVDNAVASKIDDRPFRVDIIFDTVGNDNEIVSVYFVDNCRGMDIDTLKAALQPGKSATTSSRLNEHGFGLKNALATLSGGNGVWELWTKAIGASRVHSCKGPFDSEMEIEEDSSFPATVLLPTDVSTVIKVDVKFAFIQTVQRRGAPAKDLALLRTWLVEHLGVLYRGFLEQDSSTCQVDGSIFVSIKSDKVQVVPLAVPMSSLQTEYLEIELGGSVVKLEYKYGSLDEVKKDKMVRGDKAKFYYQGNQKTQGIDIRLGKRVIATALFETIWKTQDGLDQLARHNNYNDFVGELLIPELPRGVLTTVNNKTDFNLSDPDWTKVFERLNSIRPVEKIREKTEAKLRINWIRMLRATNPNDTVSDEISVWPTGTRIDVYRKGANSYLTIYELKAGAASPQDLYQLKMYWDGLVRNGEQPDEASLIVADYTGAVEQMVKEMNLLTAPNLNFNQSPPGAPSKPYNFTLIKHASIGL